MVPQYLYLSNLVIKSISGQEMDRKVFIELVHNFAQLFAKSKIVDVQNDTESTAEFQKVVANSNALELVL